MVKSMPSPTPPASKPSSARANLTRGTISPIFVGVMIGLTAAMTVAMVSLVFYRSQSVTEPTSAVMVRGDASLDGAIVRVSQGDTEIAAPTLLADNQFATPILLKPGLYKIEVTLGGRPLLSDRFNARSLEFINYDLPSSLVVQGDSSQSGAVVQVSGGHDRTSSIVLGVDNDYAAISYHGPGSYHVVVAHDGRVLRDQIVRMSLHQPKRILLASSIDIAPFGNQNN